MVFTIGYKFRPCTLLNPNTQVLVTATWMPRSFVEALHTKGIHRNSFGLALADSANYSGEDDPWSKRRFLQDRPIWQLWSLIYRLLWYPWEWGLHIFFQLRIISWSFVLMLCWWWWWCVLLDGQMNRYGANSSLKVSKAEWVFCTFFFVPGNISCGGVYFSSVFSHHHSGSQSPWWESEILSLWHFFPQIF